MRKMMKKKKTLSGLLLLILLIAVLFTRGKEVSAASLDQGRSESFGAYEVYLADAADLLTEQEEDALMEKMQPIAEFGNVAFLSTDANKETAEKLCRNFFASRWGKGTSGTIFLIDMRSRMLWIHSDGLIYETITSSYANTITDNVYTYASDGDYCSCAEETFEEIYTLLSGSKIAQPMKYICNALLSLILSALLVFVYIRFVLIARAPSDDEMLEHIAYHCNIDQLECDFTIQTKKYCPHDSDSSGGGGGGGGGGSSSSGGGGGHSF